MMQTDSKLVRFLQSKHESIGVYTHVSLINPMGRFNVSRQSIEEFWSIYCDLLHTNPNFISGLAEKPTGMNKKEAYYTPVMNDTDIKITYDPKIHKLDRPLYEQSHIENVVKVYQKNLKNVIDNYRDYHGICFVLEKELPTLYPESNQISHGFHLHFINTFMSNVDQDIHVIPRVREEVKNKNIFQSLKLDENVIDSGITKKCWLLYGSRKDPNRQYYKVTKIYNDKCEEITLDEALKNYTLLDVNGSEIELNEDNYEYYLPRILSIDSENKDVVKVSNNINIINRHNLLKAQEIKRNIIEDESVEDLMKMTKKLIKLISVNRLEEYDDWTDLGFVLHSIGKGCQEALDIWIDFSSKNTSNHDRSEKRCVYAWSHMSCDRGKTIGSLKRWAKLDNPEEYAKIQKKEENEKVKDIINGGHYDLALWLKTKYGDSFRCYDSTKNHWFRYEGHRWKYDQDGNTLMNKIPTDLVKEFKKRRKQIREEIGDDDDDDESNNKQLKSLNKMIANLKSTPFMKSVLKACQLVFFDEEFVERLDNDPYLMHFKNGILDLRKGKLRDGEPDDYVSLTTGYEFKIYQEDDPDVLSVHEHLNKVFPDPELKAYFLAYCGTLLEGGNKSKKFMVSSGGGNNAKSINAELLRLVLGKYMRILPTTIITGKKPQSSAATPEFSGIQGVRYVSINEPEEGEFINIGRMKELTGNDVMYVRGLFQGFQNVLPMFKLSLNCNDLPKFQCDDPASWNRIRVLPYESTFTFDRSIIPDSLEEQFQRKIFPCDDSFSEKLPKMKQPFVWLMFEEYKRQQKFKASEPEKVKQATLKYRENNDVFYQFIKEKVVDDDTATVTLGELFSSFREWHKSSFPTRSCPDKNSMKKDLTAKWGKANQKWEGYRLRTDEDDVKEGKAFILTGDDLEDKEEVKEEDDNIENDVCIYIDDNIKITKFKTMIIKKDIKLVFKGDDEEKEVKENTSGKKKVVKKVESDDESDDESDESNEEDEEKKVESSEEESEEESSDESEDESSESDDDAISESDDDKVIIRNRSATTPLVSKKKKIASDDEESSDDESDDEDSE